MGSILITVPDLADHDLIFNERETRQVLRFFWPHQASRIDSLVISDHARRLAQTALVAAIEGSYAMGHVEATLRSLLSQRRSVSALGRRLAQRFVAHWWKHATREDLLQAQVYDSVRVTVSAALKPRLQALLSGIALRRPLLMAPFDLRVGDAVQPGLS